MKNGCTVIVLLCRINVYTEPGKMASTGFHDFPHAIKHDEKNAIWVFLLPMLDLDKRIETKSLYMPDNKNFCLRVKALDGLLRKREGVTIHEMLHVVNESLEDRGICPVKTKDTILKDLTEIANEYHIRILRMRDTEDSRIIRYRYENSNFSIFETGLSEEQGRELRYALRMLTRCKGFPKVKWIQKLCLAMDVPMKDDSKNILEFDVAIGKISQKCFQGLFLAIIEKKTVEINYLDSDSLSVQVVVFPYYLKQFAQKWYLVAVLTTNGKVLQFFELERIRKIYFTDKKYEPMEIDLDAYFSDIYGIHREMGKKPVTIKFQVSRGYIRPFIDDPIHHSQVLVCLKHECAIFSIRVVPNIELIHKFLSYGDTVTILTDCEFRDEIVKNLKRSIRNYELST